MNLDIQFHQSTKQAVPTTEIRQVLEQLMPFLGYRGQYTVEVDIVGQHRMRTLNRQYRTVDRPTDVLSFPIQTNVPHETAAGRAQLIGSIVICPDCISAKKVPIVSRLAIPNNYSAEQQSATIDLAVHGLMHLLGMDHETKRDFSRWQKTVTQFQLRAQRR